MAEAKNGAGRSSSRAGRSLLLGTNRSSGDAVSLDLTTLTRHVAMLGSTGSGKTVMAKALIEESTVSGVPSIIVDPQGDLARLILLGDRKELKSKGGDTLRQKRFAEQAEVRIWTPLREKGLPICIDPFSAPPDGLSDAEATDAWDLIATGFTNLALYDKEKAEGIQVHAYIFQLLVHSIRLGHDVHDFSALSRLLRGPHGILRTHLKQEVDCEWDEIAEEHELPDFEAMLPRGTREKLSRTLGAFTSGNRSLLFSNGVPLDIETLLEPSVSGKVPVNVIYLNTITDDAQRHAFLQEIGRAIYDWMLSKTSTDSPLDLLFFIDEVAPFLPPVRNPPGKEIIKLIFKQARKYGIGCVLATQNVTDVDYKILAQANTKFIGKMELQQDIERVRHLLREGKGETKFVDELTKLGPGEFQLVCTDLSPEPIPLKVRWLYSDHGEPLTEEQIEELTPKRLRTWAGKKTVRTQRSGIASAAAAASVRAKGLVSPEFQGMAAAGKGQVDESPFEVRLLGGLAVLKEGRDPVYLMQSISNIGSALALLWTLVVLLGEWRSGGLTLAWAGLSVVITSCVAFIVGLETLLSHDAELQKRISRSARAIQYFLGAWLWFLLIWSKSGAGPDFGIGSSVLEVAVVWVSLFISIELVNRVRLGSISFDGGNSVKEMIQSSVKGVGAIITESEFKQMQASSKQVMNGLRWALDFCTLLYFCVIIFTVTLAGDVPIDQALSRLGGEAFITSPALWLGSIYLLLFLAFSFSRVRNNFHSN